MARTYGIDTSHWEGVIDWQKVKNTAVKFAIHKATEDTYYVDTQFIANKTGCQAIGMPWAAYHYFRPQKDAILQARHFYASVGTGCHVYIIDVEAAGENLAAKVKVFVEELSRLGAPTVMIYTGPYFWLENVGNVAWAKEYPLWIANYEVYQPMIPLPWTEYKIWQYSDNGYIDGIDAAVDENWFIGDIQAVFDFFQNAVIVPPPPPPSSDFLMECIVDSLNVRTGPGTAYGVVGQLHRGEEVALMNVGGSAAWMQIKSGPYAGKWCAVQTSVRYMDPK